MIRDRRRRGILRAFARSKERQARAGMADVRTTHCELPGFSGELVHPGETDYDDLRGVFNGMIDRRPALIARCTSADDVVEAINLARQDGLPLSVYGGGHGVTGAAVVD